MRYPSVLFPVALLIGLMALAACGGGGSEDESPQAASGVEPQVAGATEEPGATDVQAEAEAAAQAKAQAKAQAEAEPPPLSARQIVDATEDLRAAVLADLGVSEEVAIFEIKTRTAAPPLGLADAATLWAVYTTGVTRAVCCAGLHSIDVYYEILETAVEIYPRGQVVPTVIAGWQQKANVSLPLVVTDLAEGLRATVEPSLVDVYLEGSVSDVADFLQRLRQVSVSAADLEPGEHFLRMDLTDRLIGFDGTALEGTNSATEAPILHPGVTVTGLENAVARVQVEPLGPPDGGAPEAHFLAIYRAEAGAKDQPPVDWQQVAWLELESLPAFLWEGAVRQVEIAPGEVWFEVQGFFMGKSAVYELISFDGTALETRLTWFSPNPARARAISADFEVYSLFDPRDSYLYAPGNGPGAGELSDLDEDGRPEVLLNATGANVFCVGCGVWIPDVVVHRWDGADLTRVEIESLPASAPAEARAAVDRAKAFVRADLWRDALEAIEFAEQTGYADETLKWDAILIRLIAELRMEHAEFSVNHTRRHEPIWDRAAYPLLAYVFAGEYAKAVDLLRRYEPEEIFNVSGLALRESGTAADAYVQHLGGWLVDFASRAVVALAPWAPHPDLAPAHFLLGLGEYFLDPDNGAVIRASVEQAHLLEVADTVVLYALSTVYLLE